ncbi:MAG: flagellar protein FlaG [Kiloniellales bacterium]
MDVTSLSPLPQPAAKPAATGAPAPADSGGGYRVESLDRLLEQAVPKTEEVVDEPLGRTPAKLKVTLDIDEGTKRVIASLVDPETGEVKQQLPAEELLNSAEKLHQLLDRIIDIKV